MEKLRSGDALWWAQKETRSLAQLSTLQGLPETWGGPYRVPSSRVYFSALCFQREEREIYIELEGTCCIQSQILLNPLLHHLQHHLQIRTSITRGAFSKSMSITSSITSVTSNITSRVSPPTSQSASPPGSSPASPPASPSAPKVSHPGTTWAPQTGLAGHPNPTGSVMLPHHPLWGESTAPQEAPGFGV